MNDKALTEDDARMGTCKELPALDASMPDRIWLQIDASGDANDRSEPMPPDKLDGVTWCRTPIGGIEVEYVRADLAEDEYERGQSECLSAVIAILDNEDVGVGECREPWESVRRRLLLLMDIAWDKSEITLP